MQRIEGYWYSEVFPESFKYPVPEENTIQPKIKKSFLEKLDRVQMLLEERRQLRTFRGCSRCRLCNQSNGNGEYVTEEWIWPDGYIHYVRDHNVAPSEDFFDYIMNGDFNVNN